MAEKKKKMDPFVKDFVIIMALMLVVEDAFIVIVLLFLLDKI